MIAKNPRSMEIYDFFYEEFGNLKALTGFTQWDQLNDHPNAKEEINKVINAMVEMTEKEPFNILKPKVVQRVVHDAVMNDSEFRGLNAKFVLKALNHFWGIHGESVLQKHHEQNKLPVVQVEIKDPGYVDALIKNFLNSLRATAPPPKIQDPAKEGKEWQSELERKAVSVEIDPERKPYTIETLEARNRSIRQMQEKTFRERNPEASDEEVALFMQSVLKHEVKIPDKDSKSRR